MSLYHSDLPLRIMRLDDDLRYFETQEFKDILEKYETAREAGSPIYMDADELTDVAEYYAMVQNDNKLADEAIELALQLHPDAVDPQIFRARQSMLAGDNDRALQLCEAIQDQQDREVYFLRAELMVRNNETRKAQALLLERSDEVTEDRDYFLFDSAYIFIDYHDYQTAKTFAVELDEMAPIWFKTWELWADVHLGLEEYEKALVYIEKMLDKDPFYLNAWNWRTEAYCGLYDYKKAAESTDYAVAIDPKSERALELKAWVLMRLENFEDAHKLYQKLQEMNCDSEFHPLYDSYCLFDLGRIEEAEKMIWRAESLADGVSEEQAAIYEHHAHILSVQGSIEKALYYIDLAEESAQVDQDKSEKQQDFDYYRARIYADNGDSERALKYIERIAAKDKEPVPTVICQGAQILFEAGDFLTAMELFSHLLEQVDDKAMRAQIYPYLAYCYHELDDATKCLKYIRLAIDNDSPEITEILGSLFAENVQPSDYYDYYYYRINGRWPGN